ncbi:MAG TPA: CDP-alcohol phosphatidyltransferase family protein [Methanofastidiosum sp.]|nr:CDP-alcohol phosphatidyltransferase family protein [Methanofastidiosum sp.]HQK62402.1 CDP-alcohol phosphatidyltransferase family protein [Methanofastidiosum sp.]HQQ48646.1 CDP-alcohol phosphatidyltransferase family protein [Methanofastidiosum sp.]
MFVPSGNKLSIANSITYLRVILIVFLIYFAYAKNLLAFSIVFYTCGISDYLDGPISRKMKSESELGSHLDFMADGILFLLSFLFIYLIKPEIYTDNRIAYSIFLLAFLFERILFVIKNHGRSRIHTYSAKLFIGFYYFFLPVIFFLDSYRILLYILLILGSWAFIELSLLYLLYPDDNSDRKSIFSDRNNPSYFIATLPMRIILLPFLLYFVYLNHYILFLLAFIISVLLDFVDFSFINRIKADSQNQRIIYQFANDYYIIIILIFAMLNELSFQLPGIFLYELIVLIIIMLIKKSISKNSNSDPIIVPEKIFLFTTYAFLPLIITLRNNNVLFTLIILAVLFSIIQYSTHAKHVKSDSSTSPD